MASLASINVRFSVDLRDFSSQMQNSLRQIDSAGQKLQSIGRGLSAAVTLPIVGLGLASLKTFGDIQALQKGLISVMGSSEAAAVEFEKLKEVAKLPGLGLEEAVRGSVNLQAAGFSADEARRALLSFGNALATVGKGKRELDLVTLAITQLNNKSGGFGQDLRQLTEQLPQLRGALQNAFGTVDTETISKSGVTGKQVVNALITEFEKLPKVTGGLNNAFENFADSSKLALSSFGDSINKAFNVEGLLNSLGETLSRLAEKFSSLSPEAQKTIVVFAGVAAAIGPVLIAIGAVTSFVPSVVTGLLSIRTAVASLTATIAANPIGALAVALSLIAGSYLLFNQETEKAITKVDTLNQLNEQAASVISAQKSQLEQFLSVARDDNKSRAEKEKAIRSINKISPEYLGNIKLETINTDEAKKSIEQYNIALLEAGKAKAAQSALQANYSKQLQAELKYENATAGTAEKIVAAQQKLNASRGNDNYFQVLREVNKLIQEQQGLLDASLDPLKKEEAIILSVFNKYKDKLGLIKDVNTATMDLSKSNEKVFAPGTVAFYEAQIKALQTLQNETAKSSESWDAYGKSIDAVQKKIDLITGKIGVKLPKPQIDTTDPIAPPAFSLQDLGDQKTYFENLRLQFSTTSDEYLKLTEQINNTQIKINAIEGVDEFKTSVDEIKTKVTDFSSELTNNISNGLTQFAEGFAKIISDAGVSFNSVGSLLFSVIGDMMVQLGKAAISIGITMLAIKAAFKTPLAAIAAGAALIIAGSIIKTKVQDAGAFANGGIVGGTSFTGDKLFARVNSGEMIINKKQQSNLSRMINPAVTAGDVAISLMGGFELEGSVLKLVLARTDAKEKRIR